MKISKIAEILEAEVLCCDGHTENEVMSACASDMMSDVLAFVKDHAVLITGLCNPQVIRTAEMMDIVCVVYVRGKKPDAMSIELAESKNIVLMTSKYRMYQACGLLFSQGMHGGDCLI
ncbi:MAG: DRTGG domain-containing protein [Clostridia bacterium]|nr:DRTGG domain-containing protein [Clostridia bacterium]